MGVGKYTGTLQALRTVLAEEGVRGLWRGTLPALLLWVPYTAIQFSTLERLNRACTAAGIEHDKPPASFACGAAAAAIATTATYPLDLLRTIMAAQGVPPVYPTLLSALTGTLRDRGPAGLFSGVGLTLTEIIPYAALQFGSYAALKAALQAHHVRAGEERAARLSLPPPPPQPPLSTWDKFLCGLVAGCASKLVLHPVDVAKKRMQVQGLLRAPGYGASVQRGAYRSAAHCLLTLARREGLAGLYKGLTPNLLKAAPASGITFVAYELLVGQMRARQLFCS